MQVEGTKNTGSLKIRTVKSALVSKIHQSTNQTSDGQEMVNMDAVPKDKEYFFTNDQNNYAVYVAGSLDESWHGGLTAAQWLKRCDV